jgi:hypothetical protein
MPLQSPVTFTASYSRMNGKIHCLYSRTPVTIPTLVGKNYKKDQYTYLLYSSLVLSDMICRNPSSQIKLKP